MKRSNSAACGHIRRRDFLKRTAAAGFSVAVAGGLVVGARPSAAADTPKRGGHLILGIHAAYTSDTLDPANYLNTFMQLVGHQLYNTLTEVDGQTRAQPVLAESWEAKPGAKEWIFKIRKGVTFHNGETLTAADIVYSINHHRDEKSESAAKALLKPIVEIKATGQHELAILLDGGNADLPYLLADYHLCIGPEGTKFDDGVGTGSFILQNFWPGVRALTKRNPNNWRENRGFVDSVETIGITDPAARVSALLSGDVHLINRVDTRAVSHLQSDPDFTVHEIISNTHYTLPMRCDQAPFDNKDVRLALKYAIDREAWVAKVLSGHGAVGNDHPISKSNPYFAADLPQRSYDPDKARFHFKQSGYDGPIVLSIAEAAFVGAVSGAQLFQASAKEAGIDFQIDRTSDDGYWDNVWMKQPFCGSYWEGRPTADLSFSVCYKSDAPWNESFWKREDFDKILLEARAELNQAKRKELYATLQQMVHEDSGEIVPVFINNIEATTSRLKGLQSYPTLQVAGFRGPEMVWFDS